MNSIVKVQFILIAKTTIRGICGMFPLELDPSIPYLWQNQKLLSRSDLFLSSLLGMNKTGFHNNIVFLLSILDFWIFVNAMLKEIKIWIELSQHQSLGRCVMIKNVVIHCCFWSWVTMGIIFVYKVRSNFTDVFMFFDY